MLPGIYGDPAIEEYFAITSEMIHAQEVVRRFLVTTNAVAPGRILLLRQPYGLALALVLRVRGGDDDRQVTALTLEAERDAPTVPNYFPSSRLYVPPPDAVEGRVDRVNLLDVDGIIKSKIKVDARRAIDDPSQKVRRGWWVDVVVLGGGVAWLVA